MRTAEGDPSTRAPRRVKNRHRPHRARRGRDPLDSVSLNGDCVRDPSGAELGRIEGVILDGSRNRIAYAVLSLGAALGGNAKLFAVPWSALSVNHDEACVILHFPRERLTAAPAFARDSWPSILDPTWRHEIDAYYGVHP